MSREVTTSFLCLPGDSITPRSRDLARPRGKNSKTFYTSKASAGPDDGLVRQEYTKNLVLPQVLAGIYNIHEIDQLGMYK